MSSQPTSIRSPRAQAWFPGVFMPVSNFSGVEVFRKPRRGGVQVTRTTIHGTAPELRHLAYQLLAAAERVDPRTPHAAKAAA